MPLKPALRKGFMTAKLVVLKSEWEAVRVTLSWMEFLLVVALLELTPGPNMAWLATLTLDKGRAAGLQAVLGIALGLCIYLIAAIAGLGALMAAQPQLLAGLRWLGVFYLVYLAFEPWIERAKQGAETGLADAKVVSIHAGQHFMRGLTLNILNPKAALFYVTLLPRFVDESGGQVWVESLWLGLTHIAVATGIHLAIVLAAGGLRPWLSAGKRRTYLNVFFTLALLGIAAWLAWDGLAHPI
jgi:threonine/homoserine/homoserine lactone efflux protein